MQLVSKPSALDLTQLVNKQTLTTSLQKNTDETPLPITNPISPYFSDPIDPYRGHTTLSAKPLYSTQTPDLEHLRIASYGSIYRTIIMGTTERTVLQEPLYLSRLHATILKATFIGPILSQGARERIDSSVTDILPQCGKAVLSQGARERIASSVTDILSQCGKAVYEYKLQISDYKSSNLFFKCDGLRKTFFVTFNQEGQVLDHQYELPPNVTLSSRKQ